MTHIAPGLYDSGVRWNETRILVSFEYPPIPIRECDYAAFLEGIEPPSGHILDEPQWWPQGWGATKHEALEEILQMLVECDPKDDPTR